VTVPAYIDFTFRALSEDRPGAIWQHEFNTRWPAYHRWFLHYGEQDRPSYYDSIKALRQYMPEFQTTYETMIELAGGGDHAARFLAQYNPPPLFRACSQAVYIQDEPVIVRNYDYSPFMFDGLVMRSQYDQRAVIAMTDCMSGLLDGMNQDGLALSMTFGGHKEFCDGFAITISLRYVLEYATNVKEAIELLKGIPVHGAYNVTLVDRTGETATLIFTPGQDTRVSDAVTATNHQPGSSWPKYEQKVKTFSRLERLEEIIENKQDSIDSFAFNFLQAPLYNNQFARGFGTLYTAAYFPARGECLYLWPGHEWRFNFNNFQPAEYSLQFIDPEGNPKQGGVYAKKSSGTRIPGLQF